MLRTFLRINEIVMNTPASHAVRNTLALAIVQLAAAGMLVACASGPMSDGPRAVAKLMPTRGNTAAGTATFVQQGGKVLVTADITGLKPNSEHGFHVHERGDCSSGDGESAGGHFNPFGKPHAAVATTERHVGDILSLKADSTGRAVYKAETELMTVTAGAASIVGKGLIVHLNPDDYKTQPTGNAGARIACAVIERSR